MTAFNQQSHLMNWISFSLKCFVALLLACATGNAAEYVILSGGPALRKWEDLRHVGEQHDRWWGNFVATAVTRAKEIKKAQPELQVTWLVYTPAYSRRTAADKKPLTSYIMEKSKYGIKVVPFSNGGDVINYLNGRARGSITGFEYFGHSNKFCFMFDYSSEIYGVSTAWLHQNDLKRLRGSVFASNAYCQSWGCHTAEAMSDEWKRVTGVWLVGAIGKTDYTDLHLRNNRVALSSGAHWKRSP